MLRECTLGSSRVLRFYQHKIYNYNTCSCCTSWCLLLWISKLLHLRCNGSWLLYKLCWVGILGISNKDYSNARSFMGNLYWSSLANSLTDYDWCNLPKRNCFQCGVTVLWPECYTLEVKLGTIDTSVRYKYSTIMGTGIVHPSLTHFKAVMQLLQAIYT